MTIEVLAADMERDIPALAAVDEASYGPGDLFDQEDWGFYKDIFQFHWVLADGVRAGSVSLGIDMDAWVTEDDVPPARKGCLYIASIQILPEFQGRGIGSTIKEWIEAYARQNGFGRIASLCRKSNEVIIHLNGKFGFEFVVEIPDLWEDPIEPGLVFVRNLGVVS